MHCLHEWYHKGDPNILLFQAGHAAENNIQSGEAGNTVGNGRYHIVKAQHGICSVVIAGANRTQYRAQHTKNADKVQSCLPDSALCEGSQRNGDQLDAAKKQGQIVKPVPGIFAAEAQQNDLEQLKAINQQRRPDQHPVLLPGQGVFVSQAQKGRKTDHDHHQRGDEHKMLPG